MTYDLDEDLLAALRRETESPAGCVSARIQSLWSGYGAIFRFDTGHASPSSLIVKHVSPPNARRHPRGWSSDVGHERKLRSYDIELIWYRDFAPRCPKESRVPHAHHLQAVEGAWLFVLEDLDVAGFPRRRSNLSRKEMRGCLSWLAHFHATFLGQSPGGLWPVGTYWHLATRPDELKAMRDRRLRDAAPRIDAALGAARFSTLVHGDAKVANFCFATSGDEVAAVDFQYVGGGVGVKDLAYFLSSCLDENECLREADEWVEIYFEMLRGALAQAQPEVDAVAVEAEWRALYPLAWADFMRFLIGWAPDHYKIHGYSQKMTERALGQLD